jgi:hypothetical protein
LSVIAFHEKAGRRQVSSFLVLLDKVSHVLRSIVC